VHSSLQSDYFSSVNPTQHALDMSTCSWNSLPTELKLHTIGFLSLDSVKSLSEVSHDTYKMCVPTLFRVCSNSGPAPAHSSPAEIVQNITLNNYEALSSFSRHLPDPYYCHVRSLFVCLKPSLASNDFIDQTSALANILSSATRVESLSLHFIGSPAKTIIPPFRNLKDLRSLHISNCGDENLQPLCVA
jgi:hypothetical protein